MTFFSRKSLASSLILFAALGLSSAAKADTIGNPPVSAGNVDTCPGCDYILNQAFASTGDTVSSYSFYSFQAGSLTPVLLTLSTVGGTAQFTVVGVGTAVTTTGAGLYSNVAFGLTSGTDLTTTDTYFGFASSAPTVAYSYFDPTTPVTAGLGNYFALGVYDTVGNTFNSGQDSAYVMDSLAGINDRTYSIDVTAVAPPPPPIVPEPSSLLLFGTGLLGIAGAARKRFKA